MRLAPLLAVLLAVLCGGCSSAASHRPAPHPRSTPALASARNVGPGPPFRPSPTGALVADRKQVRGMRCRPPGPVVAAAHLEMFAAGHVVVIPAGIGFAPPLRRRGAYVDGGRCAYRVRTMEPTGLLLMGAGRPLTLGRLFDLWGQPLGLHTLAGFSAAHGTEVSVFIDGSRWRGDPSLAPIARGAQIAVEVGPYVPPHAHYTFPALRSAASRR